MHDTSHTNIRALRSFQLKAQKWQIDVLVQTFTPSWSQIHISETLSRCKDPH